ncbi:hypothetical protein VNO78_11552 [Psophocarpus tetragonolobus]|uniref:Uncharacterized protein n=1 Tax=Psophocarpus tetragonolobus TaxID=3891 RepID=A0AAN9XNJ7_PSOTE
MFDPLRTNNFHNLEVSWATSLIGGNSAQHYVQPTIKEIFRIFCSSLVFWVRTLGPKSKDKDQMSKSVTKPARLTNPRGASWITLKFRGVLNVVRASKYQSSYVALERNRPIVSEARTDRPYWMHPDQQFYSTKSNNTSSNVKGTKDVKVQPEASAPAPAPISKYFAFPHWLRWILGMVLSLLLPFRKPYCGKLQRIEEEVELVAEEAEVVAEVVEKVATMAEKVAEDVAEMLPEDGKLRKAASVVQRASKEAAHDAQLTQQFIHKVEELKNDLEDIDAFVEPVINKIVKM